MLNLNFTSTITLVPQENKRKKYKISIGRNLLRKLPQLLKKFQYSKYVIVTDTRVRRLYGETIRSELKKAGIGCELISFAAGEESKKLKTVETLLNKMLALGCDRRTCIIALGGGVTGDIAGFLASVYMRGIDFIELPTTLLAMADSSIGGKTGVNTISGKNLIGTFHQPIAVIIDIETLNTLPDDEFKNGYAEIIKMAAIRNKSFFKFLEKRNGKILARDMKKLKKLITTSVRIKADIVSRDTKEAGLRMILNYGHTYGHAIEKALKYRMHHGYAVAIGMCIINQMAVKQKLMKKKHADRIENLLKKTGLPTTMPAKLNKNILNQLIKSDKKRENSVQNIVIVPKLGTAAIVEV